MKCIRVDYMPFHTITWMNTYLLNMLTFHSYLSVKETYSIHTS